MKLIRNVMIVLGCSLFFTFCNVSNDDEGYDEEFECCCKTIAVGKVEYAQTSKELCDDADGECVDKEMCK